MIMLAALLLLLSPSWATTYNVRFCFQYEPRYDDADPAFGDDYVDEDTVGTYYPARGSRIVVTESPVVPGNDNWAAWRRCGSFQGR